MNSHIAAAMAAERHCDLQEIAGRRRTALSARAHHGWRERIGALRRLGRAGAQSD